MNKIWTT